MSFRIERVVFPDDVDAMMEIGRKAFATDALYQAGLPKDITPEQMAEHQAWRRLMTLQRANKPNTHYFKAVEESTGEMAGFSGWHGPIPKSERPPDEPNVPERYPGMPKFLDRAYYDDLSEKFKSARERIMGDRDDYWFLQSMAVAPEFQGRGVAFKLVGDTLKNFIDVDGAECYLEASPAGKRLYEKSGFEVRETISHLDGTYIFAAMVRPGGRKMPEVVTAR